MPTIYIDNVPYEVKEGVNLLHACLSLGFDVPYFCWHPAMKSVGACRQCAVKQFRDETDTKGRIVMSCMTPAADGTRISLDDPEVRAFRKSVIEWLMISHPHDCPVCDEGGECHLQDMTLMTGHTYRKYRFRKRTYRNQYLGPLVNHDLNRCIQCYRCVRFYRDYAGGRDLEVFAAHHHVYFGRHREGVLESPFSGNLVEICPTGVFTDKTLKRHYTRKWDLQTAPSVCVQCGLGCNTIPGERYGMLRRIRNRYNGEVNRYFLCDRGRYGYEFVNSDRRIRHPLVRDPGERVVSREEALDSLASLLYFGARVIGIGSPRASLEANFALRSLVGPERFYSGMGTGEHRLVSRAADLLRAGPARSPSLRDIALSDAVLVLGEDVQNTAPVMALALRQSVRRKPMESVRRLRIPEWDDNAVREAMQQEKSPFFSATPCRTDLDPFATQVYHAAPADIARFGFAVARALGDPTPATGEIPDAVRTMAQEAARALKEAANPLVVSGTGCGSGEVLEAASRIAGALCRGGAAASLSLAVPECNSLGMGLMEAGGLDEAFSAAERGDADTVIILENDLFRRDDAQRVEAFFSRCSHIVVIDHTATRTTERAGVVLPAAVFAEGDGTLVNNEGRAQRFYQVFTPAHGAQESWRWLRDVMLATRRELVREWKGLDDIGSALAASLPVFGKITEIAPPASFRVAGKRIPRQPHRYSGRTAMFADRTVHEPRPPADPDSPLAFTMEGYEGQPPAPLIPRFWAPGWNSIQSLTRFQEEVDGPLRGGDPGKRLIEPPAVPEALRSGSVPEAFLPRKDEWLLLPLYHVFGSEEMSVLAPGIAELVPSPYIGLPPEDAAALGIQEGGEAEVGCGGALYRAPVRYLPSLPKGTAGVPAGLPGGLAGGFAGVELPAWGKITFPGRKQ
ncbi:MAG: NADH-quinone oxidoreductase subunit NuoG [Alphaproteobacteria bacterium]|uniref:NADH-quinone oxidoreductase n=1 Tax=Candidatus Nitrobium versatile TaxID=2884831 RepID=A0A953JCK8_9BACT|nr:NADH-quinone oxidoreductase subunit NuoG [Candidatus Nitrobium versatile]